IPAIVSTQLALMQSMSEFPDFNPMQQIDIAIQQMAEQQGKTTGGLETAKSQIDKLYGTPIAKQADDLMQMVRHEAESAQLSKQLAQAYLNQDLDTLWKLANDPVLAGDEDDMERLIYSRNRQWVNDMPQLMSERPILFAVGAGHLPSPQGVIALLRQKGYTVEPVAKKF
ncbi:MAG: TraB/GumN family protein, partial [Muribaculaceae bacterium]|nr:TraB/GumN family protein [Muribaculaceae bacterium]